MQKKEEGNVVLDKFHRGRKQKRYAEMSDGSINSLSVFIRGSICEEIERPTTISISKHSLGSPAKDSHEGLSTGA